MSRSIQRSEGEAQKHAKTKGQKVAKKLRSAQAYLTQMGENLESVAQRAVHVPNMPRPLFPHCDRQLR